MRKSKLSESKQACLLEHFVGGATARCDGSLVEANKTTAAYCVTWNNLRQHCLLWLLA